MASNITLSAGVRQNLLFVAEHRRSDEHDAEPACHGQEGQLRARQPGQLLHLAALNNRASDLNSLLELDRPGAARRSKPPTRASPSLTKLVEVREVDRQAGASGASAGRGRYWAVLCHGQSDRRKPWRRSPARAGERHRLGNVGDATRSPSRVNGTTYRHGHLQQRRRRGDGGDELRRSAVDGRHGCAAVQVLESRRHQPGGITLTAQRRRHRLRDHRQRRLGGSRLDRRRVTNRTQLDQPARSIIGGRRHGRSTLTVAVNGGSNQVINFGTTARGQCSTSRRDSTPRLAPSPGSPARRNRRPIALTLRKLASSADELEHATATLDRLDHAISTASALRRRHHQRRRRRLTTPDATRTSLQIRLQQRPHPDRYARRRLLLQRHQPAQRRQPQGGVQRKRHELADDLAASTYQHHRSGHRPA